MLILKSCSIQSGLRKAVSQRREATSWKYGEVSHDRKDATWMGPVKGRAGEDEPDTDYPGNIKTPNWMLGENGDEIAEKMKVLFKGYDPTLKKPIANFRMRLAPGKATAAPPVGPSFSQMGAKPIDFIKAYNDATMGLFVPDPELKLKVYVRFYEDKTYQWKVLPPTTAWLIRKAAGLPAIGVSGFGAGNPPQISGKWAGYITLQQLYHVAALANTWNNFPDWLPLEFRVDGLIKQADVQGICVLGVHSAPPPMLGKSDAQQYEYIREMKKKWTDDRLKEMDRNPLDRLPWATKYDEGRRQIRETKTESHTETQLVSTLLPNRIRGA
eukprot:TRINITY_DN12072_c0_g1_i3.p1 TRINITY_DN12072_c0_g1~~TRINITY_DN12072_c0_g1_i3.p1  ORF type:complete len:327 (+),score=41.24 TRINITY_DN12072_c0_g1_i3:72-1052(+)